jgi:hypothetical protein
MIATHANGHAMKPALKGGMVAAGYVIAILVACAAVTIRIASRSDAAEQASSGMYAFGDAILFVAVFGILALVPTGAALFFLRPYLQFWVVLSAFSIGIAVTSVAAALLYSIGREEVASTLALWAAFSVLRILVTPLLALAFFVATLISPYRYPRLAFFGAALMEAGVSAYAGFAWFLPLFLNR